MRAAVISHTYVEPKNRGKLEALARANVAVTAYVPAQWHESALRNRWHVTHQQHANLEIIPVPVRRLLGTPAAAWWNLSILREHLSRGRHELLHIEEEPWSLVARSALAVARKHRVPSVIFTWQNLPGLPPWPLSVVVRRTLRLASGWIAGNEAAAGLLRALEPDKPLVTLPQLGVDVPARRQTETNVDGPLRVAYVGRLVGEKGVTDLLAALRGTAQPWTLTVVGNGPERERLEAQTRQLPHPSRVLFRGSIPHGDVEQLWSSLDVLVLPSRTTPQWAEQFGHVLIEAMAHGVAVIGSSSGAIPDVIGDAGVVFREGDVAELRHALSQLREDRQLLGELRRHGRARAVSHFSNEAIGQRTIAFWRVVRDRRATSAGVPRSQTEHGARRDET
jgi:glycosyltransferase involved in cell wall biosynthesis